MPGLEKGAQNGNKLGKIYKNTIVALKDYNEKGNFLFLQKNLCIHVN